MSRSRLIVLALAIVAVFSVAVTAIVLRKDDAKPADTSTPSRTSASQRSVQIATRDGVTLAADVFTPKGAKHPALVVMPAAWGRPGAMYRPIALRLARAGYVVVAYAQRGFQGSGGQVDLAGSRTQTDVSDVIDWALKTTPANEKHIGAFGISYGAGVSLLAAAKDRRIRAVVALSTWTDLAASFNPSGTPSTGAVGALFRSEASQTRLDTTTAALRSEVEKQPTRVGATIDKLSPTRSPASYVADYNANGTAILLANGYQDSLFGSEQLVSFFDRLTTEKRLQLAPGDHGGPEASALQGKQNSTVADGEAWIDHFLRGADNNINTEDPIALTDGSSGALHTYTRWPRPDARDVLRLGVPGSKDQTGRGAAATWSTTIGAGADTVASSGGSYTPFGAYRYPRASLLSLSSVLAFAWTGPQFDQPTLVSGTPQLRLRLSSTKTSGTLVAYLYDVDLKGVGQLISVGPYSFQGRKVGSVAPVTIGMQPLSWTVETGHRLVFVVDTQDPRYTSLNPRGARLTASSDTTTPSVAIVPYG